MADRNAIVTVIAPTVMSWIFVAFVRFFYPPNTLQSIVAELNNAYSQIYFLAPFISATLCVMLLYNFARTRSRDAAFWVATFIAIPARILFVLRLWSIDIRDFLPAQWSWTDFWRVWVLFYYGHSFIEWHLSIQEPLEDFTDYNPHDDDSEDEAPAVDRDRKQLMEYKACSGQHAIDLEAGIRIYRDLPSFENTWSYDNPDVRGILTLLFRFTGPIFCFIYRLIASDISAITTLELLIIMGHICLEFLAAAVLGPPCCCCGDDTDTSDVDDGIIKENRKRRWLYGWVLS